jgi:hypothetical protein
MEEESPLRELTEEEVALKQRYLKEKLEGRTQYEAPVIARYICQVTNTPNLTYLANRPNGVFGVMPDAWSLVRERTLGVEFGSVKREDGSPNTELVFHLDDDGKSRMQQAISCYMSPQNKETCRFLDDPRIPAKECWVNPGTGQPVGGDLSKAHIYQWVVRHRRSTVPINVDVSLLHTHHGINQVQDLETQDKLFEGAGGTKGAFMTVTQTTVDGEDVKHVPIPSMGFGPTSPAFVKTMMLVNRDNIKNGIIKIPREVCLEARLPVYKGTPEADERVLEGLMSQMSLEGDADKAEARQKMMDAAERGWNESLKNDPSKERVECFYAVPVMHVLSWPLHSDAFLQQKKVEVELLRFRPAGEGNDPVALYYLVSDVFFQGMVDGFFDSSLGWWDKLDCRPLNETGVKLVPFTDRARYKDTIPGDVHTVKGMTMIRSYIKYMVPPVGLSPQAIASLAPTLAPGFLRSEEYVSEEEQQQLAVDKAMRERGGH